MTLSELVRLLDQHGVSLTLSDAGKLRPTAERPPPTEVIEGIKTHRVPLVCRLERGQRADGRYYLKDLLSRTGHCASCARWKPEAPGALLGCCPLLGQLGIHAAHRCPVDAWVGAA